MIVGDWADEYGDRVDDVHRIDRFTNDMSNPAARVAYGPLVAYSKVISNRTVGQPIARSSGRTF